MGNIPSLHDVQYEALLSGLLMSLHSFNHNLMVRKKETRVEERRKAENDAAADDSVPICLQADEIKVICCGKPHRLLTYILDLRSDKPRIYSEFIQNCIEREQTKVSHFLFPSVMTMYV